MQGIKTGKIIKYATLPGIIPRAKSLFASGFGYIAFLMATIYNSVRLIPAHHPYVQPENIGKFGVRHVIAEAANNLTLKKENMDQLFIFSATLVGLIILCLQFVLLIYAFIFQPAFAGTLGGFTGSIFDTPDPRRDIAFLLLDQVFGVPRYSCNNDGLCSEVSATLGANGLPFHIALHSMFQFYSIGLLLIGVLIFLYFVVILIGETATSGTPFGQRFQNVWVPIRLVVALGLLVPINYGLNSGQYITLYAAKYGSGFATNAWLRFNRTIQETSRPGTANPTGEEQLLSKPITPDIASVVSFMSLAHSCAYAHWKTSGDWKMFSTETGGTGPDDPPRRYWQSYANPNQFPNGQAILNAPTLPPNPGARIRPYFVKNVFPWMGNLSPREIVTASTTYEEAMNFYGKGDIIIRFGLIADDTFNVNHVDEFKKYKGQVEPTCGEMRIPIVDGGNVGQDANQGGANEMQKYYFNLVRDLWVERNTELVALAHRSTESRLATWPRVSCYIRCDLQEPAGILPVCSRTNVPGFGTVCTDFPPNVKARQQVVNNYQATLANAVQQTWQNYNQNSTDKEMNDEILARGWGGAGIWYNKIAEMNGVFITSVMDVPAPSLYPLLMEKVVEEKMKRDRTVSPKTKYQPNYADGQTAAVFTGSDQLIAESLNNHYVYWNKDGTNLAIGDKVVTSNAFETIMNVLFGTSGLFDMRKDNQFVHPLAQLTGVGKALVDNAVRNTMGATAASALGGALGASAEWAKIGKLGEVFGSFLFSTAFVGLTAGLVLFYVLPFLPFVYFYFAVGSWVKGIFEAMVGVPLWALAHLRIDGEGLPGESATNGYFLIFEIFIRPILTVFALVASMVIFTAQVRVLNFIWGLVVDNLAGAELNPDIDTTLFGLSVQRGIIDQFFYTIVYTIIVYMLATASFKLIDKIPDNILRWMGAGVSSFSDINDDPVQGLTKYAALGGLTVGQQVTGGLQQAAGQVGKTGGGALSGLRGMVDKT